MKVQKSSTQNKSGFTIVELLIVIVVIGILASITVVAYSGIRNKATVAALTSELSTVAKLLSIDQLTNNAYPATLYEANGGNGISPGSGTTYDYIPSTAGYCITATQNSLSYRMTNYSGPKPGACSGAQRDMVSTIKWGSWTLGTGAVTGYGLNGDGNSRINATNPWGVSDIVWDVSNQDATSDADGGWNGGNFAIDNTKMYRFSTFIKRKTIGNGSTYLGTHGYPSPVLHRSDGVANGNPYFFYGGWWGNVNQWYLVTGHIWPAGSGAGAEMTDSGVYSMAGTKIVSTRDFVWQPTTTSSDHRSYLYYSTDVTTNQQWYQPRVDIIDGTEPTIRELVNDTF